MRSNLIHTALVCFAFLLANDLVTAAPITTGLLGWFDASDAATVLDTNGNPASSGSFNGSIGTWVDKASLQGTQSAVKSSGAPGYTASSKNGLPAIHFDGNDTLTTPAIDFGHFTYFAAWRGDANSILIYERSPDTNSFDGDYLNASTNATVVAKRTGDFSAKDNIAGSAWGQDGVFRISEQSFDGTHASHVLFLNGAAASLQTHTDQTIAGGYNGDQIVSAALNVGSRQGGIAGLNGDLAELLVYDHVLSAADRNAVGSYLAAKYAVTTAYVPEPSTLLLSCLGAIGLWAVGSSRRRS